MNGGYKATPHTVRRILDTNGQVLYDGSYDNPPRVLSETIAATMNSMLTRVIQEGTGKAARLDDWQAAGKSGTTQSFRDALFVGYTDRKSVVSGKSVSVRVDLGGRRIIKQKNTYKQDMQTQTHITS